MDPLSRLPLECLQHIFNILAHRNDSASLRTFCALLRVNRCIATAALPYLYHDPHRGIYYERSDKKRECTRSLLACLSFDVLPPTLAHCLARDPLFTQAPNPTFDYLSYVRYLHPPLFGQEPLIFRPDKEYTVEELAYLQGEGYSRLRQSICVLPTYVSSYSSENEFLRDLHKTILYRETVWSLAFPILDQLESLTIPLSDIDRYVEAIDRLGRLERIDVCIDEVYEDGNRLVDEPTRQCKEKAMGTLLHFVENHGRLFVGRLRAVNIGDRLMVNKQYIAPIWRRGYETDFEDVQLQIHRLLPPMPPPTILNESNWARLMMNPLTTNLRYVEQITARQEQLSEPHFDYPRLFQRCRALKALCIPTMGKGSFKWAVQEKKSVGGEPGDLVPLEKLQMQIYDALTDDVDDIAFAFSKTLQSIYIRDVAQSLTIRIGQGWVDMPKLTHLCIHVRMNRLLLDSLLLAHCPNLIEVDVMDNTEEYQCSDIVSLVPAQLGQLTNLKLHCWPALTFHPATLHSTSKLRSLSISPAYVYAHTCYIPPVEELEQSFAAQDDILLDEMGASAGSGSRSGKGSRTEGSHSERAIQAGIGHRPLWTWDWVLPQLSLLRLFGEFAYRFEFRMLQGCPSLEFLTLMIVTEQNTHTRTITEDDFFVTIPAIVQTISTSEQQRPRRPKTKRIFAPALHGLNLQGPWVLDDCFVPMLFHGMFPKLRDAFMQGCSGFGLKALVDCLRGKAKHIKELTLDFPEPSLEEQRELGLYPRTGRTKHSSDASQVTLTFQGVEYILLRDVATSLAAPFVSPNPLLVSNNDESL
ncbi:hypothetical protein BGZ96_000885 [Linnemannia gamsii]|uniref:F-box domain-containing protein n=1 Tax=Linnemannia gamsii TaxID=64522 RepID=A0ABQ7JN99_9FUNG|nr:hypothetical protein BGZ96_000885 [Linnemannia gamsii]